MKYMVHFNVTPEAGTAIEAREGGPGPIVGRMLERFAPEAAYFAMSKRACWWVIDLDSPSDIAELMIAVTDICGAYPEITPVASGADFGDVVSTAIPAAKKLIDG